MRKSWLNDSIQIKAAVVLLLLTPLALSAHDGHPNERQSDAALRTWEVQSGNSFEGTLISIHEKSVTLRLRDGHIIQLATDSFGNRDREWLQQKRQAIVHCNNELVKAVEPPKSSKIPLHDSFGKPHPKEPLIANHFRLFVDSKAIQTRWDKDFFYVESNGVPDHEMMVGITAWQQQIPIPQNYTGNNAWRIPLRPVVAEKPLSAKTGFFRGAIAIAVNGVPIFNPIKNDGRTDTYLAGELDEFGGHCGRADDYHYHLPPVHLEKLVGIGNPIAYALDGYPILGFQSKSESRRSKLDELNGHHDAEGNYHYHATKNYPYLNGGFHGEVTESGGQVDPQPRARGVRPALRGLRGAKITRFNRSNDGKNVRVEYRVNGESRAVSYRTEDFRNYQFKFDNGSQGQNSETYSARTHLGRRDETPNRGRGERNDRQNSNRTKQRSKMNPTEGRRNRAGRSLLEEPRQPWIVVHATEIDIDNNKIISRDEIVGEAEKAFQAYDRNSDEKLSTEELQARGGVRSAMGGFLRGHSQEIDRDLDGALSRQEVISNAERMFKKLDADLDGQISAQELNAARRQVGSKAKETRESNARRGNRRGRSRDQNQVLPSQQPLRESGQKNQGGSRLGGYESPPPANRVPSHPFDILLGRPTDHSITLSTLLYESADFYFEYGNSPQELTQKTKVMRGQAGKPVEVELTQLKKDSQYYYQLHYFPNGQSEAQKSKPFSFRTQREFGNSFRFTVQADSHLDENTSGEVYLRTLQNALNDGPDFHLALGDTFMTGKYVRPEIAEAQYLAQRFYLGTLCHSVPLFFCLGNHDGESPKGRAGRRSKQSNQRDSNSSDDVRIWSLNTRKNYIPNPSPSRATGGLTKPGFYSGNEKTLPGIGHIEDYYAWHWGNSLFVVLDPFWYSAGKSRQAGDHWNQTLGVDQYQWLKRTLETSDAKFKFIFIHHLIGGADKNNRGGIASAPYFEWGGQELDGKNTFAQNRPGWESPIHDLLVKHDVSVVFHGHDHLYAKEELDGVIYQAVPQPGHPRFGNVRSAEEYGYDGDVISSSGHLRINVSDEFARVDYVRAYLPENETKSRRNAEISDSYLIQD